MTFDHVIAQGRPHWHIHHTSRLDDRTQAISSGVKATRVSVGELHTGPYSATPHRACRDFRVDLVILFRPQQCRRFAGCAGCAAESYAIGHRRTPVVAEWRVLFFIDAQLIFDRWREILEIVDCLDVLWPQPYRFHLSLEKRYGLIPDTVYLPAQLCALKLAQISAAHGLRLGAIKILVVRFSTSHFDPPLRI